jgi:hypothetical protein
LNQESEGSIPTPGTKQPLRDRLTVGRDALNVLMLVRFQLPQFATEVIRPDEEVVLKTTSRASDLWVRVPRLPPQRAHGPTGRHKLRTLEIWVRFPVSPLAVPWSNGNDSCPTNRKRWFNSIRDYLLIRPGTPTGRAARLKPECLQVRLLLWALNTHGSVGNWQTTLA